MDTFNTVGLDYMFTGALAASYYGTPRTTTDVDIVVKVSREDLRTRLVPALRKAKLKVDVESIEAALDTGFEIVTLRDIESPFTVDIIFSRKELEKKAGTVLGLPTFYQTPEELILAKLRMIKATVPKERALKDKDAHVKVLIQPAWFQLFPRAGFAFRIAFGGRFYVSGKGDRHIWATFSKLVPDSFYRRQFLPPVDVNKRANKGLCHHKSRQTQHHTNLFM